MPPRIYLLWSCFTNAPAPPPSRTVNYVDFALYIENRDGAVERIYTIDDVAKAYTLSPSELYEWQDACLDVNHTYNYLLCISNRSHRCSLLMDPAVGISNPMIQ